MVKSMKRRHVLKTLGLGCIGFGIAPKISAKTIKSYFAGTEYPDDELKDYLHKIQNFNHPHADDVLIDDNLYVTFESAVMRLRRLQKLAGHGNYNILNFTDGLALARNYSRIGEFTKQELGFMELTFYADGQRYGFLGQKPLEEITDQVKKKDVLKIPHSGN